MSYGAMPKFFSGWIIESVEFSLIETHSYQTTVVTEVHSYDQTERQQAGTDSSTAEHFELKQEQVRSIYGQDIACICELFNLMLKNNSLAAEYLPMSETSIFHGLYEGVLLCAMVNLLEPNSIDASSVTMRSDLAHSSDEDRVILEMQNRNLALSMLQPLGVTVDCSALQDLLQKGNVFALTSVLVQVLRLATIGRMSFKDHEVLVYLFDGWSNREEAKEILATNREQMLLRWVNYQMQKSGSDIQLKNLDASLADCTVYAHLLWTISPTTIRDQLIPIGDILKSSDYITRAERVIASAEKLGIVGVITPLHIAQVGAERDTVAGLHRIALNIAFLYSLFSVYPNISVPAPSTTSPDADASANVTAVASEQLQQAWCRRGATEETLIRWLNSFGPTDPVQSIESDLSDGSVLLQVWNAMIPGCVTWAKVKLDRAALSAKRKFQWMCNCEEVLDCAINAGISKNCCSPADIVNGNKQNILSLVFLMMRLHSQLSRKRVIGRGSKVADLDDAGLVKWFNTTILKFGSNFQIGGLSDERLKNTNVIGFFGERLLVELHLCFSGQNPNTTKTPPPVPPKPAKVPPPPQAPQKSTQKSLQLVPKPSQQLQVVKKTPPAPPPPPPPPSPPQGNPELQLVAKPPQELQAVQKAPPPPPLTPQKSPQLQLVPKPSQQLQVVKKAPPNPPPPPPTPSPQKLPQQALVPKPPQQLQAVQKTAPQKSPSPGAGNAKPLASNLPTKQVSSLAVPQKQPQRNSNTGGISSYTSYTSVSSRTVEKHSKTVTKTAINITKWSSGNRNATEDPAAEQEEPESGNNASSTGGWMFKEVSPVSGEELAKFSVAAILMFNKAGVVVYASRLGPDTDAAVYRSILLQLNALSMKKA